MKNLNKVLKLQAKRDNADLIALYTTLNEKDFKEQIEAIRRAEIAESEAVEIILIKKQQQAIKNWGKQQEKRENNEDSQSVTHTGGIPSFIGGHKVGDGTVNEPVNTGSIPSFVGSGRVK